MPYFETVTGRISDNQMGHCQPHEHIYIVETPALLTNIELRLNNLASSIEELKTYKAAGGVTLADANPLGAGRDARALKTASEVSGVQIIATTGYHIPLFYNTDHWIWSSPEEKLEELFVRELTEGMFLGGQFEWPVYQIPVKAGLIKAMLTKEGVSGRTEVLLKAAGKAAVRTGTSLMLHTEYGTGALQAVNLLEKLGLAPEHILICHVDRQTEDMFIHEEIAGTGVYMEYDTITMFDIHDNASEIRMLKHMIDRGYADRILISTDPTADRMKQYEGTVGIDYILTEFLPMLRNEGISQDILNRITKENPAEALCKWKES